MEYPLETKIGIVGGGQLGKMMLLQARKMGFYTAVLDPTPDCPAHGLVDSQIVADFYDEAAIRRLADETDVLTYEYEHIGVQVLLKLEAEGKKIYPTAASLKIIQDKLSQKTVMKNGGVPVPDFIEIPGLNDIYKAGKVFGYPLMLKSRTGGYDGKGNAVVNTPEEAPEAYEALGGGKLPLMAERMVDFTIDRKSVV